jgi:ferric-dicitrate binding protein FerR (iron transport regulator)
MSPDETERLIFEVLDGSADAKQRGDLAALLAADPDALTTYCRCCELDSALHRIAKGRGSLGTVASLAATGTEDRLGVRTPLLAAVAAVLLLGALLWLFRAPAVESLARISTSPDALYNELHSKEGPTPAGELVAGSAVWLSQGSVELVFQNGVRSVIEAPAEWVMVDENRMDLRHGVAWFEVPPAAAGFQVFTPDLEVTDLGTEFGVLAEQGKNDQVHVFSGAVHARHRSAPATVPQIRLSAGMAATASPLRLLDLISVEPERFSESIPAVLPHLRWSFASRGPQGWLLGICFVREAPERAIGSDRRVGKRGLRGKRGDWVELKR